MAELTERFKPGELHILKVAAHLLKITNPYKKDNKGYNKPEAWLVKYMLERDINDFSMHNLEWLRRALLKYKRQIEELGYNYALLQTPSSDKAIYGWKTLDDSKFLGMDLIIAKKSQFIFKWRNFKDHKTHKVKIILSRLEGFQFLAEHDAAMAPKHVQEAEASDLQLKISYYPESSRKFLTVFGLGI